MSDLTQLSHACTEALRDAEARGAKIAAHFLRVQVRDLFRDCSHREAADAETETTRKNRIHG